MHIAFILSVVLTLFSHRFFDEWAMCLLEKKHLKTLLFSFLDRSMFDIALSTFTKFLDICVANAHVMISQLRHSTPSKILSNICRTTDVAPFHT